MVFISKSLRDDKITNNYYRAMVRMGQGGRDTNYDEVQLIKRSRFLYSWLSGTWERKKKRM